MTKKLGKEERLGLVTITNCINHDFSWAVEEMKAVQLQNTRATGDKNYHLMISFPKGEEPNQPILQDIESRVCEALGFAEHQRISAVHHDTDNMHIHVAINKIHPKHFTMHEPYLAYKTLAKVATELEIKHGLQRTNHERKKSISQNKASDLEHHTGIESFLSWIKKECLMELAKALTWEEFNDTLKKHALFLEHRGNGFIIKNKEGLAVKASSVSRDFSKESLKKRFGTLESTAHQEKIESTASTFASRPHISSVESSKLFEIYKQAQLNAKEKRAISITKALTAKAKQIEQIKDKARLKRIIIKNLKTSAFNKKWMYSLVSKKVKKDIDAVTRQYVKNKKEIMNQTQKMVWKDWLRSESEKGVEEALQELRKHVSNSQAQQQPGNYLHGKPKNLSPFKGLKADSVTKQGTIIYKVGQSVIRDEGQQLKISHESCEKSRKTLLDIAVYRFGRTIHLNGHESFKQAILTTVIKENIHVNFADQTLEVERKKRIQQQNNKEINNEYRRDRQFNRSADTTRNPGAYRGNRGRGGNSQYTLPKQDLKCIGQSPPPEGINRLRNLSELHMVQLANGSEMLLSRNVSSNLEQQGTYSNHELRREISIDLQSKKGIDYYISERNEKRHTMKDILFHRKFTLEDTGKANFAGIRHKDNETFALFKKNEEMLLMMIDIEQEAQLKHLKIGEPLSLTRNGQIKLNRGRSL